MRVARDDDVLARHEHLRGPARAAQHGRRAHLAAHRLHLAVGRHRVEVEIGVRVDEVDARQRAFDRDVLRGIEPAETVVRPGRRGQHDRGERKRPSTLSTWSPSSSHCGGNCRARVLHGRAEGREPSDVGPHPQQIVISARQRHDRRVRLAELARRAAARRRPGRTARAAARRRGSCSGSRRTTRRARPRSRASRDAGSTPDRGSGRRPRASRHARRTCLRRSARRLRSCRGRREQRRRQVAAQALDAAALHSHGVVDVHAELLAAAIAVEQRRPDFRRQRRRHEQRVAAERVEHDLAGALRGGAVLGKLTIALRERGLRPARDVAVDPLRASMSRRTSASWAAVRTSGIWISIGRDAEARRESPGDA